MKRCIIQIQLPSNVIAWSTIKSVTLIWNANPHKSGANNFISQFDNNAVIFLIGKIFHGLTVENSPIWCALQNHPWKQKSLVNWENISSNLDSVSLQKNKADVH